MIKKIPAREEITCDICNKKFDQQDSRANGSILLKRAGLDWAGCAVGDGSKKWDTCMSCMDIIEKRICELIEKNNDGGKK